MGRQTAAALAVALIVCAASGCTSASGSGDTTMLTALAPVPASTTQAAGDDQTPLPTPAPDQASSSRGAADTSSLTAPTANAAAVTPVAFAAVIGAPDSAMEPLSREMAARAKLRGVAVTQADSIGSGHILRGYFSTVDEGKSGRVVYVWDVVDASGKRVYRIQGEQQLAQGGDWSRVSDATMRAIADDTVDQLARWLAARKG